MLPNLMGKPCTLQAVELLREVTGVEPAEYDRQQAADAAGVKNVAIFLTELSTRQAHPSIMHAMFLFTGRYSCRNKEHHIVTL